MDLIQIVFCISGMFQLLILIVKNEFISFRMKDENTVQNEVLCFQNLKLLQVFKSRKTKESYIPNSILLAYNQTISCMKMFSVQNNFLA